jgi:ACS family glucarate transporter-like MFS transporter
MPQPNPPSPSLTPPTALGGAEAARRRSHLRWSIVGLSALGLTVAYLDRASLSVAMPFISKEYDLGPAVRGVVLSAFFWSYALCQVPSGWLLDRFGLGCSTRSRSAGGRYGRR